MPSNGVADDDTDGGLVMGKPEASYAEELKEEQESYHPRKQTVLNQGCRMPFYLLFNFLSTKGQCQRDGRCPGRHPCLSDGASNDPDTHTDLCRAADAGTLSVPASGSTKK